MLLLMVAELHRRGYEQLRIAPYMAPSGMYWRCRFVPKQATMRRHGADAAGDLADKITYSSSAAFAYFDWGDCARPNPIDLADRFVAAFPEVIAASRGADAGYALWFRSMLELTEPLGLVYAFSDFEDATDTLYVTGECDARKVALPSPGDAAS
jgi:hypothetical protein